MSKATDAIIQKYGLEALLETLDTMEPSKVQSVMMEIAARLAHRNDAGQLLEKYAQNRFVQAGRVPPQKLLELEARAFALLPAGFEALTLSPLAPLGCVSAFGQVNQDKVVSACRGTEVIADATNVLALECALRRKKAGPEETVHLCASHRNTRAQQYTNPNARAHFLMFSLCSAGRVDGAEHFVPDTLRLHIRYHEALLRAVFGEKEPLLLRFTTGDAPQALRLAEEIGAGWAARPAVRVEYQAQDGNSGYYDGFRFQLALLRGDSPAFLADGGLNDWTAQLLRNRKERLITSGMPLEGLGMLG